MRTSSAPFATARAGMGEGKPVGQFSHPTGAAAPGEKATIPAELPLFDGRGEPARGGSVACGSCHDPHVDVQRSPKMLRGAHSPVGLCVACHQVQAAVAEGPHDRGDQSRRLARDKPQREPLHVMSSAAQQRCGQEALDRLAVCADAVAVRRGLCWLSSRGRLGEECGLAGGGLAGASAADRQAQGRGWAACVAGAAARRPGHGVQDLPRSARRGDAVPAAPDGVGAARRGRALCAIPTAASSIAVCTGRGWTRR